MDTRGDIKWVMLTVFATFSCFVPVASQSKHSFCVFPWRPLILDESTTVVDHHVCLKPLTQLPTMPSAAQIWINFTVSIKIMVEMLLSVVNNNWDALDSADWLNEPARICKVQLHVLLIRMLSWRHDESFLISLIVKLLFPKPRKLCVHPCWLVDLSAWLLKNYWMIFHKTWMEDGYQPQ